MPPQLLYDISGIDPTKVLYGPEEISRSNPHRGPMVQLDGVVYVDTETGRIVGVRHVREDEFWVAGHIPGRPLLPGVLMIEAAAQLASFYTKRFRGWKGFVGFNGVEDTKFRLQIAPGKTILLVGQQMWQRHRRMCCKVQGLVEGSLAFETSIVGVELPD